MSFNEKTSSKDSLEKAGQSEPELFNQDVRHALAAELDIVDEKKADLLFQQAEAISDEEAEEIMREILEEHRHNPFFPSRVLELARDFTENPHVKEDPVHYQRLLKEVKMEAALIVNDSPYVEVRAVVSPTDDPNEACSTVRSWTIGIILACFGALINQLFSLRQPSIYVDQIVAQLLAYPLGKYWGEWMPSFINPGKFTRKEHMLITVMANVSFDVGYSGYIIVVQLVPTFFNQQWAKSFLYQITLSLSFQLMGYGLAGLSRRFLVYPSAAIWPRNLATIALNNSFHAEVNPTANGWKVSQLRFFLYAFGGMFVYFWFPNYIAAFLSYFSWMTWIAPDNVKLAAITGSQSGLGLNPIPTFDWNVVIATATPLISPFFTTLNNFVGMLLTLPIIVALWVYNVWYTAYMPININKPYDRFGARYKVTSIVNEDGLFDQAAYEAYSPLYLSASNAFLYGVFFAIYPATIVYAYLYHRHEIVRGFKSLIRRHNPKAYQRDVHNRLMSVYPEVPEWWYGILLLAAITLGLIALLAFPTHATVGSLFMGIALAFVFVVPIGVIYAVTNMQVTLNVLAEFIGGLLFPGNALAMNMFKSYGYVTTARALTFAQDLKLGHYSKVPPRIMFAAQTIATIISTTVAMAILNWQVTGIKGVCTPDAQAKFYCPGTSTFFTASVIWGTLGPARMYGKDGPYFVLLFGFVLGAIMPIPFYFLAKRFPDNKFIRGIHIPIFLGGGLNWAPYNLSHAWPAVPIAWFFQVYVRKHYLAWWQKYNYILSTAFDCGVAIAAIVTFFALQWPGVEISWWGNDIVNVGADAYPGTALLPVPDIGYWGPSSGWH
ncbi:Sexual differentiation process protein isp4 [Serendipita indica DSM 11827]|uniref:Related to sexual differentiation process protein n=1 Tax=Serendipita indica (strain DSM 11827) TaxID=1109443 RepID=G4TR34_SERID|nr:Sexual differentiation process protein isp4 [Serendipita indica DSM 11827]CCA73777.1 related to sexual differentiation process protein [Serendipita indica DSM 11827]